MNLFKRKTKEEKVEAVQMVTTDNYTEKIEKLFDHAIKRLNEGATIHFFYENTFGYENATGTVLNQIEFFISDYSYSPAYSQTNQIEVHDGKYVISFEKDGIFGSLKLERLLKLKEAIIEDNGELFSPGSIFLIEYIPEHVRLKIEKANSI